MIQQQQQKLENKYKIKRLYYIPKEKERAGEEKCPDRRRTPIDWRTQTTLVLTWLLKREREREREAVDARAGAWWWPGMAGQEI